MSAPFPPSRTSPPAPPVIVSAPSKPSISTDFQEETIVELFNVSSPDNSYFNNKASSKEVDVCRV